MYLVRLQKGLEKRRLMFFKSAPDAHEFALAHALPGTHIDVCRSTGTYHHENPMLMQWEVLKSFTVRSRETFNYAR